MLLETRLPLGKVDPGLRAPELPLDVHSIAPTRACSKRSVTADFVEETKDDPFILLSLAAQATRTLKLGTSVAIAFPPQSDRDRDELMDAANCPSLDRFQVCMKPLVATAANETELMPKVRDARADRLLCLNAAISRRVEHLGLGDRLKLPSRAQRWEELPQHINEDVLHTTNCEFSIAVKNDARDAHHDRLRQLASDIQSQGVARARRTILGIAA